MKVNKGWFWIVVVIILIVFFSVILIMGYIKNEQKHKLLQEFNSAPLLNTGVVE